VTHLREEFYRLHNGTAAKLPLLDQEYKAGIKGLRAIKEPMGLEAVVLISIAIVLSKTCCLPWWN